MISRKINYLKSQSFFLFGPRGIGKSSWVKQAFPSAQYFDLLDSDIYQDLLASPKRLESRLAQPEPEWVIIDEIQKIPELLDEVHRLIETRKLKFILTGSSARKLKAQGANLLGGRAIRVEMHTLHSLELQDQFDWKKAIQKGLLPYAYLADESGKFLKTYVTTYLKEEIQQEGLVRSLSAFARFLEAASFSQGSMLNISKIAEQCAIGRKAAQGYFQILEDLLLASKVPIFTKRAKRKLVSHPKFYFFDTGVFRAIRPQGPLDIDSELNGLCFETLVFQEIQGLKTVLDLEFELYYWRSQAGDEVDFILYGPSTFTAIEVKSSIRLRNEDFKGLATFGQDYPQAKRVLVYGGDRSYFQDGIQVFSAADFFKSWMQMT